MDVLTASHRLVAAAAVFLVAATAHAADVSGTVRDSGGGVLPGVTTGVDPGHYQILFTLINFAAVRRDVDVTTSMRLDVMMQLALNADVTVTGKRTFANLADVENPAENLVGIAQSASQGAITARQIEERPLMRDAEVLEAVPGVIVMQHSGEGKANQYFLRGFNLDHGTD